MRNIYIRVREAVLRPQRATLQGTAEERFPLSRPTVLLAVQITQEKNTKRKRASEVVKVY